MDARWEIRETLKLASAGWKPRYEDQWGGVVWTYEDGKTYDERESTLIILDTETQNYEVYRFAADVEAKTLEEVMGA
jgi:hypothetical protein